MDGTVTIYADVLFFINLSMDFLCLYVTARLMCVKVRLWRLVVGAALGGVYACLSLMLFDLPRAAALVLHLLSAVAICACAYGKSRLFARTGAFVVSCGVLGGLMCGAYSLMGKDYISDGGFYFDVNPLFVPVFAVAASLASLLYLLLCRKRKCMACAEVGFDFCGRHFCARLLCDSGCFVRDALSGSPVIIVSRRVLDGVADITGADERTLSALGKTSRLIPVGTVSGGGVLAAFRPDRVTVKTEKQREIDAVIAVDCGDTDYGGFEGIIPTEILEAL